MGKWPASFGKFQAHVLYGSLNFLTLFIAAALINMTQNLFARWLSPWLVSGADLVSKAIFWGDTIIYGIVLVKSAVEFLLDIWRT